MEFWLVVGKEGSVEIDEKTRAGKPTHHSTGKGDGESMYRVPIISVKKLFRKTQILRFFDTKLSLFKAK